MKKLFLLAVLLSCGAAHASIATIYYGPAAAGSANGTSCANAYAYNDATHGWAVSGMWGSGGTQIGAGTTVMICQGTYTFAGGATGLPVLGSGTSGNYITIQGDTTGTVIFQSPYFGNANPFSTTCGPIGSCNAAIQVYHQNYIILDGGKNFIIQNTADGSASLGYANQQGSMHLFLSGDHIVARGFTSKAVYVNEGASPSASDTGGAGTVNVLIDNASTNIAVYNNTFNSSRIGITGNFGSTTGPNSCPTPTGNIGVTATPPTLNTASNWGICIFNNTLSDHAWQMQYSGPDTVNVFANEWGDSTVSNGGTLSGWLNWQYPTSTYHQNGLFAYNSDSGTNAPITVYAYGNYDHGDLGQGSPTGHMSCNFGSNGGCSMIAFNNIIVQTASTQNPGDASNDQLFSTYTDSSLTFGPFKYYNNTLIGGAFALQIYTNGSTASPIPAYTWENNIWVPTAWYDNESNGGTVMSVGTIDYNDYNGAAALSGQFQLNNTAYSAGQPLATSFANWKTGCSCDSHSVLAPPNLTSSYRLQAGSPGQGTGINLSGLSINALNVDAAGVTRGTTWDMGAYAFQGAITNPYNPGGVFSLLPPTNLRVVSIDGQPITADLDLEEQRYLAQGRLLADRLW